VKSYALTPLKWLGIAIAGLITILSIVLGWVGGLPAQNVIFYAVATFAILLWIWRYCISRWTTEDVTGSRALTDMGRLAGGNDHSQEESERPSTAMAIKSLAVANKWPILGLVLIFGIYIILSLTVEGFLDVANTFAFLIIAGLLVVGAIMNRYLAQNKSAFIGITLLVGLFVIGSFTIEGFASSNNIKSMLVFASFLGLACVGQTLVVLVGGLDLSIPFLIGSSNIGLAYLLALGVPSWLAIICILVIGAAIGLINGALSLRVQGQALILTLGVGFAISGLTQIITSLGTGYAGNVHGEVPGWLSNIAAMNGTTFGLNFPPVILVWILISILLIIALRHTVYGRHLYALGGNRTSAHRLQISERRYWIGVYAISGFTSAMTGILLLGWSGGGFIDVGDPYLFTTLAAVVIGGTSLLGGSGGYGFTVIGVLVLQVLTSFLVGIGLEHEGQQFVLGLLLLPMVALYARSPHIRTQV
jgi:ribose transport system permease protein